MTPFDEQRLIVEQKDPFTPSGTLATFVDSDITSDFIFGRNTRKREPIPNSLSTVIVPWRSIKIPYHSEPHACALADFPCGKKGFKDPFHHFRRHPVTGILDYKLDVFSRRDIQIKHGSIRLKIYIVEINFQLPPILHGQSSIGGKVHKHLLYLCG